MEQSVGVAWQHLGQDSSLLPQNPHHNKGDHLKFDLCYRLKLDKIAVKRLHLSLNTQSLCR